MPWDEVDWTAVGTGLLFTVVVLFQGLKGFFLGRQGGAKPTPSSVEIAGALIDNKRVDLLVAELGASSASHLTLSRAIERNIEAMERHREALVEAKQSLERNTNQAREVAQEAESLSHDMRALGDRMILSRRSGD